MLRSPDAVADREAAIGRAMHSPRDNSSTSPPASTTVRPSTHSRTVPYLNVAAPAAQVATAPPAKAPRYVGTGGNHRPAFASSSCNTCSGTPAPARTRSPVDADACRDDRWRGRCRRTAWRRRSATTARRPPARAAPPEGTPTPRRSIGAAARRQRFRRDSVRRLRDRTRRRVQAPAPLRKKADAP